MPIRRPPVPCLLALAAFAAAMPAAGAGSGDHAHGSAIAVTPGHATGHVHDHADQTWPPQPRGMRNVVLLGDPGAAARNAGLRERQVAMRERLALALPAVRELLGSRYTRPDLVDPSGKARGDDRRERLVYFSHDTNRTVEVTLEEGSVSGVRSIAASEYQPDVTEEETTEAAGIARAWFAARGAGRVASLEAYGILAYGPDGSGFYPVRVIYLSFHAGRDAPPEFAAWVDLTNRRVLRTREEAP